MIMVKASLDKKQDHSSRITRAKVAGGVAQAIEHLPRKHEVLISNSSITHKKERKKMLLMAVYQ
jgi:hypothetical protein